MHLFASLTERLLERRVRPGNEAVQRHRDVQQQAGHGYQDHDTPKNSSLGAPMSCEPRQRLSNMAASSASQVSLDRLAWSSMPESSSAVTGQLETQFERYRSELTAYAYRMLASPFEAEDAVQETFIRAWRGFNRFEGRAAVKSWLYRITTNVCLDMLSGRERRATPMDLGPSREPVESNLNIPAEVTWIQPIPDPADVAVEHETIRLAFVAALQHLPARQRAVLILCEVLRWQATEVAELLDTSVASVNSALQRARATLASRDVTSTGASAELDEADHALLVRYVEAFERYDIDALTSLIQEDASQSMPPFDMWLAGRDDILTWWFGPGIGCKGSRVIPTRQANGSPAFGQYKPSDDGGHEAWALQVLELSEGRIAEFTFFLDTETLFPLFGLPPRLDA
jgi:RNA polymerase sigma-70 factor (ECF subfamily)